jgi:hypothetical protein
VGGSGTGVFVGAGVGDTVAVGVLDGVTVEVGLDVGEGVVVDVAGAARVGGREVAATGTVGNEVRDGVEVGAGLAVTFGAVGALARTAAGACWPAHPGRVPRAMSASSTVAHRIRRQPVRLPLRARGIA